MHLNWLGQTCVKLQTKNLDEDVVISIDAYRPKNGDFPRNMAPQIALFSRGKDDGVTMAQNTFIIDTLGELEIKGVMVYAIPGPDGNIIFKINAEGMNIVHLGKITKKIENGDLEKLSGPDILFIPVGGKGEYLDAEAAANLVTTLEPRLVVPMGYHCDTDPKVGTLEEFIKEMGLKPETSEKKVIIKKKDLPQEETKIIVLEKNY